MASEPDTGEIERIMRESGRRVREDHAFTVSTKGTRENLVTSADVENERFLKSELTSLLPGSVFIGEEGDEASLHDSEWAWIVDPIDGTANFSRGIPMCAVSVALFRDAEPYAGFVLNPFTDTLYSAVVGRGAFKDGRSIRVSDRCFADSMLSTAYCCYEKSLAGPCFEVSEILYPRINDIRRIGTAALELALIAEGAGELYFEIRLSPWDYAAGLTILKEAGGCYAGIGGDVSFDGPSPVLAANSEGNLEELGEVVGKVFGGKRPYRGHPLNADQNFFREPYFLRSSSMYFECGTLTFSDPRMNGGGPTAFIRSTPSSMEMAPLSSSMSSRLMDGIHCQ